MALSSLVSNPKEEKLFINAIIKSLYDYVSTEEPLGEESIDQVTPTQIDKICFFVSKKLEVPITRSWYIFGGHCHNIPHITLNEFESKPVNSMFTPFIKEIGNAVSEYIAKSEIFKLDRLKFMLKMYQEETPANYKQLYLTHYPYLDCIGNLKDYIKEYIENPDTFVYKDYFSVFTEKEEKFQGTFLNLNTFAGIHDEIYEFNFFLEQIAFKLQVVTKNKEKFAENISDDKVTFLKELKKYYTFNAWGTIALYISSETLEGISKKEERAKNHARIGKNKKELAIKLQDFIKQASELNLIPTPTEIKNYFGENNKEYDKTLTLLQNSYSQ